MIRNRDKDNNKSGRKQQEIATTMTSIQEDNYKELFLRNLHWTRPRSRKTSMRIGLVLCSKWQSMFLKPLESRRTTRTKETGATKEGSHHLEAMDKAVMVEGKAMVGVEAETEGAPMDRFSMEWTAKTSNDASTQLRCNIWRWSKLIHHPGAHRGQHENIWWWVPL